MEITRRDFLKGLGGAACILAAAGCGFSASSLPTDITRAAKGLVNLGSLDGEVENLRQVITRNIATSRTIMWQTAGGLWADGDKKAAVVYRLADGGPPERAAATVEKFTDDGKTVDVYTAYLPSLTPARRYEYRVVYGDKSTGWHGLTAADRSGREYKILIFPDSQSADYSGWQKLAQDAAHRHPDAEWFVNMGDLVDNGEQKFQWDAWFAALDGIIDRIPIAPVMGNHECYDLKWQVRWPRAYLAHFAVPAAAPEAKNLSHAGKIGDFSRFFYSFDCGDAHFVVLNTQMHELADLPNGTALHSALLNEQLNWLKKDIAATDRKWKIALLHRDVLCYRIHNRPERREGFEDIGIWFMPLFERLDFDIVFTAHLHTYRNRGMIYRFDRARQGPYYLLTGVAGDVRYPNLWLRHALDETIAPQPETANYLTFTVSRDKIVAECFLPDGTRIDRVLIGK